MSVLPIDESTLCFEASVVSADESVDIVELSIVTVECCIVFVLCFFVLPKVLCDSMVSTSEDETDDTWDTAGGWYPG